MAAFDSSKLEEFLSNPFYLHPDESPALQLTSTVLPGVNFHSWSRAMRMALISKDKLKFVDGSIQSPSKDDPMYGSWKRCNAMVLCWIIRSLSPSIAQSVLLIDHAKDLWKDLHERSTLGDTVRISDLQEELYSLKQGTSSVTEYLQS